MMEWKPIPSAPGYFANAAGQILGPRGRVLRPNSNGRGYMHVRAAMKTRMVHQLVCEAFHGPRPEGCEVAHGDGERANNQATNLRWATKAENRADIVKHGRLLRGERHPRAQLTQSQVDEIRRRHREATGRRRVKRGTLQLLSKDFGVSIHLIKDVVAGRSWGASA